MTFDEKVLLIFNIFKPYLNYAKTKENLLMNSKKVSFFLNGKYSKKCHQVNFVLKDDMERDVLQVNYIFWPRHRTIKNTNSLIFLSKENVTKEEERWIEDQAWLATKHLELLLLKKPIIDKKLFSDFYSRKQTLSN